ncbi:MAG TPA: IPT/TIG domain-containing protein [Solirubrobacteraceae bacterium]|nr:IPT/TIG domain-containing protein [Solirubrobacteraceae bacterium]
MDRSIAGARIGLGGARTPVPRRPSRLRAAELAGLTALVLALIVAALLVADSSGGGSRSQARARSAAPGGLLALAPAARAQISAQLGADIAAYRVTGAGGGEALQARNRAQGVSASFDRAGVQLRSGALEERLSTRAIGGTGGGTPLRAAPPTAHANGVNYARGNVSEWYRNGPLGIEQGFTVERAPSARGDALTLTLGLSGNARATLSPDAKSVSLSVGAASLSYGGLVATDATGRALPGRLALAPGRLLLRLDTANARYPLTIDPLIQQNGKLTAADEEPRGELGASAALSADGGTLIVGALKDGGGAAHLFTLDGGTWVQQGSKLTPGEVGEGAEGCVSGAEGCNGCAEEALAEGGEASECAFGGSVALSADGNTALLGDPSATSAPGTVWVFTRSGVTWTRRTALTGGGKSGEGRFGRSVALSADGSTALVGDTSAHDGRGGFWVFTGGGSTWTREPELTDKEASVSAHLGRSVALSADGSTALVAGAGDTNYTGAVWQFTRGAAGWSQVPGKLTGAGTVPGDHFGKSVALSGDGGTALVGAPDAGEGAGAVWAFVRSGEGFVEQGGALNPEEGGPPESAGHFGASVALSGDGDTALIGAPRARLGVGTVTLLTRSGSGWARQKEGLGGGEASGKGWLGVAVALSGDGRTAAIGAPRDAARTGAVWVFSEESPAAIPSPTVEDVSPGRGSTVGGTEVKISGANFIGATQVMFGSTPAASFTVRTAAEITALTPAEPAGKVDVTVTTPVATSDTSSHDRFVFEEEANTPGGNTPGGDATTDPPKTRTGTNASRGVQSFVSSSAVCRVSVAKKRLAVTRYRSVALRLVRTGTGACRGQIALSYRIKAKGAGFTLWTIGTASFSIPTGTTRVITVKLSKAGQRWLRLHKGKGNASLAIARVVPSPIVAQSASVRLSLKQPRKPASVKR